MYISFTLTRFFRDSSKARIEFGSSALMNAIILMLSVRSGALTASAESFDKLAYCHVRFVDDVEHLDGSFGRSFATDEVYQESVAQFPK